MIVFKEGSGIEGTGMDSDSGKLVDFGGCIGDSGGSSGRKAAQPVWIERQNKKNNRNNNFEDLENCEKQKRFLKASTPYRVHKTESFPDFCVRNH